MEPIFKLNDFLPLDPVKCVNAAARSSTASQPHLTHAKELAFAAGVAI
jgi:hypothetical protein